MPLLGQRAVRLRQEAQFPHVDAEFALARADQGPGGPHEVPDLVQLEAGVGLFADAVPFDPDLQPRPIGDQRGEDRLAE